MMLAFDSPGSVSKVLIIDLLSTDPRRMRGATRATNNGNVPRGSSALSGAPNWLVVESVSAISIACASLAQRECKLNAKSEWRIRADNKTVEYLAWRLRFNIGGDHSLEETQRSWC
jgi:hypothetical protein